MMSTFSERSWNSSDDYEDDNSSTTTSSTARRISGDLDIPGGVITTRCVSSVIRPGNKQTHDPLQFVKIQSTELSRKAVEQIRLAEEVKITKEKLKEVEEEWQNNLLNWKSKRRQSRGTAGSDECESQESQTRKIKTFSEILNEKAKSGHRIGYNLQRYIGNNEGEDDTELISSNQNQEKVSSQVNPAQESNGQYDDSNHANNVVVVDTTLLKEYSSNYDQQQKELTQKREELNQKLQQLNSKQAELNQSSDDQFLRDNCDKGFINNDSRKLTYCDLKQNQNLDNIIEENKSNQTLNRTNCETSNFELNLTSTQPSASNEQQKNVWNYLLQQQPPLESPYSKYNEILSDEEEDDEDNLLNEDGNGLDPEAERNMLSFKAKLSAFESLSNVKDRAKMQTQTKSNMGAKKSDDQTLNYNSSASIQPPPRTYNNNITAKLWSSSKDVNLKKEDRRPNHSQSNISKPSSSSLSSSHLQPNYLEGNNLSSIQPYNDRSEYCNVQKGAQQLWDQQSGCDQEVREISERMSKTNIIKEGIYENSDPANRCLSNNLQSSNQIRQYDQQQYYLMNSNCEDENCFPNSNVDSNNYYSNQEQIDLIKNQILKNQQVGQQHSYRSSDLEANQNDASKNQFFYYGPKPYQNSTSLQKGTCNAAHGQQSRCYQPTPPSRTQNGSLSQGQYSSSSTTSTTHQSHPMHPQHYPAYYYNQPHSQSNNNKTSSTQSGYNLNHWVVQEAELRRLHYPQTKPTAAKRLIKSSSNIISSGSTENHLYENSPIMVQRMQQAQKKQQQQQQPNQQNQMLSVSGRKKCSNCGDDLGRGCAAMVIESLSLHYHINCFRCSVCHIQLGNGTCGTDVRVRNHKLHCQNCYSNDEAGLKFSRV